MSPTLPLETIRLVLRARSADDAEVLQRLWSERDPRVPAHRRLDEEGRPTVADVAAQIELEEDDPRPGLLTVVRRDEGDVIGYCGLTFGGTDIPDEPEIAFELLALTHGHGYATEAGAAVLAWAAEAGFERVWASVWDWNAASRAVLAKLDFEETGRVLGRSEHGASLLTVRRLMDPQPGDGGGR